jgi:hypothetical protein
VLLGFADLVDSVKERERSKAVGCRGVVVSRRCAGDASSDDAANGAVVEVGRLRRGLVVDVHLSLGGLAPRRQLARRTAVFDGLADPLGMTSVLA